MFVRLCNEWLCHNVFAPATDFLDDVGHAVPDAQDHHMQEIEATRGSLGGLDRFTLLVGGGLLHLFHTGCGADMVVIMADGIG